jgi:hypothetical protein
MAQQNLRQLVSENIVKTLKDIRDPHPVLVTSEPFEPDRLAITQFPAVLVTPTSETRETITMGMGGIGRRQGLITYTIRGFIRGAEIDKSRNALIEAIEESLDLDRYRSLNELGVQDSQVTEIVIEERLPPLGEFSITLEVTYNYLRGTT